MSQGSISRRSLVSGVFASVALANLPALAATMPSVDEVAFDPSIPAFANQVGDVTIVEFVDYQCLYCKLVFAEIQKLLAEDPGVRLVMKDWPIFGEVSRYAAEMALAAPYAEQYRQVVGALMTDHGRLSKRRTDDIFSDAGFDPLQARQAFAIRQPEIDGVLSRNTEQATRFGLQGTPALLIGKRLFRRGMPIANLREAVAEARRA